MANLDTQAKRMSGMNHASPWRGLGKPPTGTFTGGERQASDFLYSGIAASASSGTTISIVQPYIVVYFWKRTA